MSERTALLDEMLGDVNGRAILDVGCGAGWLVRHLAAGGANAVGVDPLADALERARAEDRGDGRTRYVAGAAELLPFDDASFDAVVFFNSLHHVPPEQLDAALAEAVRVLRHGGELHVQEPLAEGALFDLGRPVDDETQVRAAAQAALDRASASGGRLVETARREGVVELRLAGFDAWRAMMVGVDPTRAAGIDAQAQALRETFERTGRAHGDLRVFEQPVRLRVLAAR